LQAIADEHGPGGDALLGLAAEAADRDIGAIGEPLAADGERGGRGLVEIGQCQRYRLIPAILDRLGQAERGEAGGDEADGDVIAARARIASFEQVVGEECHVGADRVGGEGRFLSESRGGEGKQGDEDGKAKAHGLLF